MKNEWHKGHRKRVRNRYIEEGLQAFEDHQILELLLFYCIPMKDTNEMAHKLIQEFGSLVNLFEADPLEIQNKCGVSQTTAVHISMIPALANHYFRSKWDKNLSIDSSQIAGEYAVSLFTGKTVEVFYLLCLDSQRRLNHAALVSEGTLDETPIYMREILSAAIKHKAACVILSHNHPGGSLKPSSSDIGATKKIIQAFELMKVEVIDHIIVAGDQYYSFAARGLLGLGF